MPAFSYRALTAHGLTQEGRVLAPSREAALRRLIEDGLTPLVVGPAGSGSPDHSYAAIERQAAHMRFELHVVALYTLLLLLAGAALVVLAPGGAVALVSGVMLIAISAGFSVVLALDRQRAKRRLAAARRRFSERAPAGLAPVDGFKTLAAERVVEAEALRFVVRRLEWAGDDWLERGELAAEDTGYRGQASFGSDDASLVAVAEHWVEFVYAVDAASRRLAAGEQTRLDAEEQARLEADQARAEQARLEGSARELDALLPSASSLRS